VSVRGWCHKPTAGKMEREPEAVPVVKAEPLNNQAQQTVQVQVPPGVSAGQLISVPCNGQTVQAMVPQGVPPGGVFSVVVAGQPTVVAEPVMANDAQLARMMQERELHNDRMEMGAMSSMGAGLQHLDAAEELVLNYQHSIKCFAMIDIFISIFYVLFNIFYLILLVGPVCGYFGAQRLQRPKIGVYLAFAVMKCCFYTVDFIRGQRFWDLILVFCQMYITSFIYKFWRVLGLVDTLRLEMLLDPRYRQNVRFVYY